ncbi:MAG: hypothetical protein AABY14_01350, partial [Nanoarchaeota archaeon]
LRGVLQKAIFYISHINFKTFYSTNLRLVVNKCGIKCAPKRTDRASKEVRMPQFFDLGCR